MADVQIVGLEEFGRRLDQFSQDVERKMIRKAAGAGAEVFRREIRAKVPVRSEPGLKGKEQRGPGWLKKHIGRWSRSGSGTYSVFVGVMNKAFYWLFHEFGSSHEPANPVIRPVFDTKKGEAQQAFEESLKLQIAEALK